MTTTLTRTPAEVVAAYFGPRYNEHPVVREVYWPGSGYQEFTLSPPLILSLLKIWREDGATAVSVGLQTGAETYDYWADFQISELVGESAGGGVEA